MLDGAVQDGDLAHACLDGLDGASYLGDHPLAERARIDEVSRLPYTHAGDEAVLVVKVGVEAVDVREEEELVRAERLGDVARREVGVDVVGAAVLAKAHARDDGDVAVI